MRDDPQPRPAYARLRTGPGIHYVESGNPRGQPVVFLHGWPDSWFSFSRVMASLPRRLRAIAFDQRGFGDSDRPESGYSLPEFGADVVALLDTLDVDRAVLIGHSFGTFVARAVALADPQRVSALVLIGTGFSPVNPVTREVQTSLKDLPEPLPVQFAKDFQASTLHQAVPSQFFEQIVAESMKLPPRLWRLTFESLLEYDDTQLLSRIEIPTLLMWGDRDALFSKEDQDRLTAALPAAQLKVYEETGHCPNWERPEDVAADLVKFIEEHGTAGSPQPTSKMFDGRV